MTKQLVTLGLLLAASVTMASAQAADGKTVYDAQCKKCHGATGTPVGPMAKKFPKMAAFDAAFLAKHSEDSIVTILTKGKNADMKAFKEKMSADEMKAVAKYVHTLGK